MRQGLQRKPWDGAVRELGTLWAITGPAGESLRCFLTTHPNGWDLRLERNGELIQTSVITDQEAVFREAATWRQVVEAQR